MDTIRFTQLSLTPHHFGLVCDLVGQSAPFDGYEFGRMVKTLQFQLEQQTHLVGVVDDGLEAYLGWIVTDYEMADAWAGGRGPLHPQREGAAVAVTVLVSRSGLHMLPLIREAKRRNPDKSVFWKRDFIDGRKAIKRAVRKRAPA